MTLPRRSRISPSPSPHPEATLRDEEDDEDIEAPEPSKGAPPQLEQLDLIADFWESEQVHDAKAAHAQIRARFRRLIRADIEQLNTILDGLDAEALPWLEDALDLAMRVSQQHEQSRWALGTQDRLRMGAKERTKQIKRSRGAGVKRSAEASDWGDEIRTIANAYRATHAYSRSEYSTRNLAKHIEAALRTRRKAPKHEAIRGHLRRLGIK